MSILDKKYYDLLVKLEKVIFYLFYIGGLLTLLSMIILICIL